MTDKKNEGMKISLRSYIFSLAVIFGLMVVAYILTFLIPGGRYERIPDENGNLIIDQSVPFRFVDGGIPFWKWILAPFLVLGAEGSGTLIAVIAFLLIIGGIFNSLTACGMMQYMLEKIAVRYGKKKYRLMAVVIFFFMAMGSLIGSFEECVPLVPIVVGLAGALGWDAITGFAMSLLSAGFGFAAGVFNPFTVGVAQTLAGLPMFSGAWLRALGFVLIYALVLLMTRAHAKKVEKPESEMAARTFRPDKKFDAGIACFAGILGAGIVCVLCSGLIPALRDYTMIIVAFAFLVAGVVAVFVCGNTVKFFGRTFGEGVVKILPAVLMIMMAASIKYIFETAEILDTILHVFVGIAENLPKWLVVLCIYLIVLIMNFFVPSGSAEAVMLMPLIVPLATVFGIPAQLCVVAFAYGDGFSNVIYPTNAALLIGLGLADIGYTDWFKWCIRIQLLILALTSALLLFGLAVGYGA